MGNDKLKSLLEKMSRVIETTEQKHRKVTATWIELANKQAARLATCQNIDMLMNYSFKRLKQIQRKHETKWAK